MKRQNSVYSVLSAHLLLTVGISSHAAFAEDVKSNLTAHQPHAAFFNTLVAVMSGTWIGEYTNGTFANPTEWYPVRIEYRLTANGTALIEDYYADDGPPMNMTTVYHMDNNDLRLTHYCGAGNHPRMIARQINTEENTALFDFVDVSNHESPDAYHSRQVELSVIGTNEIEITYHGQSSGRSYSQAYTLTRKIDPDES